MAITTEIRVEYNSDIEAITDFNVYISNVFIGTIDRFPVWGLDASSDSMVAQGLSLQDSCFMVGQTPYASLNIAVAHVVANYLAA